MDTDRKTRFRAFFHLFTKLVETEVQSSIQQVNRLFWAFIHRRCVDWHHCMQIGVNMYGVERL